MGITSIPEKEYSVNAQEVGLWMSIVKVPESRGWELRIRYCTTKVDSEDRASFVRGATRLTDVLQFAWSRRVRQIIEAFIGDVDEAGYSHAMRKVYELTAQVDAVEFQCILAENRARHGITDDPTD